MKKLKVNYKDSLKDQFKELGIHSWIDLDKIKDLHESSKDGYIYDVEDGKAMLGKSVLECEEIFKKQKRRGLTVHEVLAVIRKNPKVLQNHYIDCAGSRYPDADGGFSHAPIFYFSDGRVEFSAYRIDSADSGYGSASGLLPQNFDNRNLETFENRLLTLENKMAKLEKIINLG